MPILSGGMHGTCWAPSPMQTESMRMRSRISLNTLNFPAASEEAIGKAAKKTINGGARGHAHEFLSTWISIKMKAKYTPEPVQPRQYNDR